MLSSGTAYCCRDMCTLYAVLLLLTFVVVTVAAVVIGAVSTVVIGLCYICFLELLKVVKHHNSATSCTPRQPCPAHSYAWILLRAAGPPDAAACGRLHPTKGPSEASFRDIRVNMRLKPIFHSFDEG